MGDLLLPIEVVVALLAALAVLLALVAGRRRYLFRGMGAFDCSLRLGETGTGTAWRLGVGRYAADRVDWYRIFSISPLPSVTLQRSDLDVVERRTPAGSEAFSVLAGAVIARCRYRDETVELAMADQSYTGFAAWLESAPPGQNVNVA